MPDGFCWRGEVYASLSTIARKITGTSWNGPRFFGLRGGEEAPMRERGGSGAGGERRESSPAIRIGSGLSAPREITEAWHEARRAEAAALRHLYPQVDRA